MIEEKQTQDRIREVVRQYIQLFPDEYAAFKKSMAVKVGLNADKFASIKGDHYAERKVHEMPITLHTALKMHLSEDQWRYFDSRKGALWFAKTFKPFRAGLEV